MFSLNRDKVQRMVGTSRGGSGGGGSFSAGDLAGYATQMWVQDNFLSIEFFSNIFKTYGPAETEGDPDVEILPNDTESTISNIKAMFGFWTEQYVSALGQSDGGGGGGSETLAGLLDVRLTDPQPGQILKYDGSHWINGSDSVGSVTSVAMTVPTGFSVSGSPITSSGTFAVSFASGYSLPLTEDVTKGVTAYGWGDHSLAGYALAANVYSKTEADARFLTISFFRSLFKAYAGSTEIVPNDGAVGTIDNIKAMFGFWTDQYISALGQGSGGSGGGGTLAGLTDVQLTSPTAGQILKYNGTHWINGSDSVGSVTSVGLSMPTGFSVANSPVTSSGIFSVTFSTGYSLPLTADVEKGVTAYGWGNHANAGYATTSQLSNYLPLSGGTMTGNIVLNGNPIHFIKSGGTFAILCWNATYNKYGIWYKDDTVDKMMLSASGNADTPAGADLCINGNGDGTVTIRGNTIWHAGNDGTGSGLDADLLDGRHLTQIPYLYNYSQIQASDSVTVNDLANYYASSGMIYAATDNPKGSAGWVHVWSQTWSQTNANWVSQIAIDVNGGSGMYYRCSLGSGSVVGRAWLQVIDSGNIGNQSVNYATSAGTASKLSTVSKTAWGQTYWTSGGVPDSISGNMSSVGNISFSASGKNIGGIAYFDTTNSRLGIGTSSPSYALDVNGYAKATRLYLASGVYLEYDSTNSAVQVVGAGLYTNSYISALGVSSGSGGGGVTLNQPLSGINGAGLGVPSESGQALVYNGSAWTYSGSTTLKTNTLSTTTLSAYTGSFGSSVDVQASLTVAAGNLVVTNGKAGISGAASGTYNLYVHGTGRFTDLVVGTTSTVLSTVTCATIETLNSRGLYLKTASGLSVYANAPYSNQSDIRTKNIVSDVEGSVDEIANAPIFNFEWKNAEVPNVLLGSSAQYWKDILPNAVTTAPNGYLSMDYSAIALAAAVITARKVVDHEGRIAALEAENELLREEIVNLKAQLN